VTESPQPSRKSIAGDPGREVGFSGAPDGRLPPNNLPLQLSSFVGRGHEIAEVERLLYDHRLLTLTGPGGSGKTRLALEVAAGVVEDFSDGAWVVELAPLTDPDLVPGAVATVLGVRETPGVPLVDSICVHLRSRSLLLVLDNCEHLVEASADLSSSLLQSCPDLRVLATSREALGVPGEALFPVGPLSFPDLRHLPAKESLAGYEAANLFVERARAVRRDFALTQDNAVSVAQVCYKLDGIPLAIELAAARVKALSVGQISERLEGSFALLSAGARTQVPHHRTLKAAMEWSYGLLTEEERAVLRRLSLFAGGFTLEAAEAVGSGEGIPETEILDILTSLVDKSLVLVDEHGEGNRYRLLETVRQYGREKLEEAGEAAEAGERHAEYFLRLAEEAEPELKGHDQVAWLDLLEQDHDNLRAAIRQFLDLGRIGAAARLCWSLWFFWRVHGQQGEGYRYTGEALELEGESSTEERAKLVCTRGIMSYGLESVEGTERLWRQSADLFRQTDFTSGVALSLGGLGLMALARGELALSVVHFEEALEHYAEAGDRWGTSSVLVHEGLVPLGRGDYEQAVRLFSDGLDLGRETGDRLILGHALHNLAWASQLQGDHERAMALYAEGLGVAAELGDDAGVAYCLEGIADLLSTEDQAVQKTRLYGASEAILDTIGAPLYVQMHDRELYARTLEKLRARLGETAFEIAWAEGHAMATEKAMDLALEHQAVSREQPRPSAHHPANLSTREVEVLRLLARGLTNARIAEELYISPRTVNAHLGSVYHKIGSHSRAEAARFATEHGLL
jgi:predicted ATPase/DNA-binding CsgD family transcriptional regulator